MLAVFKQRQEAVEHEQIQAEEQIIDRDIWFLDDGVIENEDNEEETHMNLQVIVEKVGLNLKGRIWDY